MNQFRRALMALSLALAPPLAWPQSVTEPVRIALIEGLSGPFANAGEAVFRNLLWAVERVNRRGGVRLPGGARPLALVRFDSKGNTEEALALLRGAIDSASASSRRATAQPPRRPWSMRWTSTTRASRNAAPCC